MVKSPTFFLIVVLIDADKALVTFSLLNSETFSHAFFKVSLKSKIRMFEVFYLLPESMVIATTELAFVLRILL